MTHKLEWNDVLDAALTRVWASDVRSNDTPGAFHLATGLWRTLKSLKRRAGVLEIKRPPQVVQAARCFASAESHRKSNEALLEANPEALAHAENSWCTTNRTPAEIADEINEAHSLALTGDWLGYHAKKRGWIRPPPPYSKPHPNAVMPGSARNAILYERIALAWLEPRRPPDNPLRLVPPKSFPAPAGGFSLIGAAADRRRAAINA